MNLKIAAYYVEFHRQKTRRGGSEAIFIERTRHNVGVLQLGVCSYEPIVPSAHRSPARNLQDVLPWSHRNTNRTVSINAVPSVLVDPPYLYQHPRPTTHAHGRIFHLERLLEWSHTVKGLRLKTLEFFLPRKHLPILTLEDLDLDVEAALLNRKRKYFVVWRVEDFDDLAIDDQLWAFEGGHF